VGDVTGHEGNGTGGALNGQASPVLLSNIKKGLDHVTSLTMVNLMGGDNCAMVA